MKDFKKTFFMKEAANGKSHSMVIEILIALLLFFIASIAMGIVQVPVMVMYLMNNKDYMSMLMTGRLDTEKMLSVMSNMPEWVMIDMLFAEILLTLVVMLYCRFFEKRKFSTLGFVKKGMAVQYLTGLVAGAMAFSVAYLLCIITGSVKFEGAATGINPLYIAGFFFGYILQGMAEEVLCRGYLMVSLSRRYHVTFSIAASSLFFAFLHGANAGLSPLAFINLFLFGVFASLLLIDCGNIWIAGAFHSIWNFVQGNIYGVRVSGTNVHSSVFVTSYTEGRDFINGGGFGMEGGMAVSIVLIAGVSLLAFRLYKKGNIIDITDQQDYLEIQRDTADRSVLNEDVIKNAHNASQSPGGNMENTVTQGTGSADINNNINNGVSSSPDTGTSNNTTGNPSATQKTAFDENYFK